MRAPDWLTARPVAHRGLHDIARGIVENMPAAARAAVDGNFAIECDIQLSADGEAMVHHDNALGRVARAEEAGGADAVGVGAPRRAVRAHAHRRPVSPHPALAQARAQAPLAGAYTPLL